MTVIGTGGRDEVGVTNHTPSISMSTGILETSLVDDPTVGLPILEGRRAVLGAKTAAGRATAGRGPCSKEVGGARLMDTAGFGCRAPTAEVVRTAAAARAAPEDRGLDH